MTTTQASPEPATVLVIDERIADDGERHRLELRAVGDQVFLHDEDGSRHVVRVEVVLAVMRRYGRPLEPEHQLDGPALPVAPGIWLRPFRYHSAVDAGPRDYAVLWAPPRPPLAVLSTVFAGALAHLVRPRNERP